MKLSTFALFPMSLSLTLSLDDAHEERDELDVQCVEGDDGVL